MKSFGEVVAIVVAVVVAVAAAAAAAAAAAIDCHHFLRLSFVEIVLVL